MKIFDIPFSNNPFFRMLLIFSLFVFTAGFVPAVGSISLIFLPSLTLFYSVVAGRIKTATAFLIPVLLIFFLSRLLQLNSPYPVILIMGIVGMVISAIAVKNSSIEKTVIYPSLILIGAICSFFIFSGYELSVNPWKLVQQFVERAIEQNINFYAQLPIGKEDIDLMKNSKPMLVNVFTGIFPVLAIVGSIIIVWINVLTGRNSLRKAAIVLPQLDGLSRWKTPEFVIWIFIITGGLFLFANEEIRFFSLNIFILTCFFYLLQGLAIISFLFQNKNVPVFFRYLFYFLIAAQQFLVIPIAIAGLLDIWVDFRRFFQKDQTVT